MLPWIWQFFYLLNSWENRIQANRRIKKIIPSIPKLTSRDASEKQCRTKNPTKDIHGKTTNACWKNFNTRTLVDQYSSSFYATIHGSSFATIHASRFSLESTTTNIFLVFFFEVFRHTIVYGIRYSSILWISPVYLLGFGCIFFVFFIFFFTKDQKGKGEEWV